MHAHVDMPYHIDRQLHQPQPHLLALIKPTAASGCACRCAVARGHCGGLVRLIVRLRLISLSRSLLTLAAVNAGAVNTGAVDATQQRMQLLTKEAGLER